MSHDFLRHFAFVLEYVLAYAPVLLERKAKQIRKDMGLSPDDHRHVRTQYESPDRQCVRLTIIM